MISELLDLWAEWAEQFISIFSDIISNSVFYPFMRLCIMVVMFVVVIAIVRMLFYVI